MSVNEVSNETQRPYFGKGDLVSRTSSFLRKLRWGSAQLLWRMIEGSNTIRVLPRFTRVARNGIAVQIFAITRESKKKRHDNSCLFFLAPRKTV